MLWRIAIKRIHVGRKCAPSPVVPENEGLANIPNIFKYATKELSQDALICWLVACAKESEGELRKCGLAFVKALFELRDRSIITKEGTLKCYPGTGGISEVTFGPKTQYRKIDVYFQARIDEKTVSFVVEDKTHTQMHGDQLERYLGTAKRDRIEEDFIKPVYFKTGHIYDNEREQAETAGFSVFGIADMIDFLNKRQRGSGRQRRALHEFLGQYADHLDGESDDREKALKNWDLNRDFVQWEFMLRLRDALKMDSAAWPRRHRNRGGSAWTQLPDWENWDRADSRFCVNEARHLYWRLDSGKPLRLMVATHVVRNHTGEWTNEKWNCWSRAFDRARKKARLPEPEKRIRRVRMRKRGRKRDFVKEGMIGAVNVAGYLEENKVDDCVQCVARLQIEFDKLIRGR